MGEYIIEIIRLLELSDPAAEELRQRELHYYEQGAIKEMEIELPKNYNTSSRQDALKETDIELRRIYNTSSLEFQAVSDLFYAYILVMQSKYTEAKYTEARIQTNNALGKFRSTGNKHNEALVRWSRGIMFFFDWNKYSGISELDEAIGTINSSITLLQPYDDKKKKYLERLIRQIKAWYGISPYAFTPLIDYLILPENNSSLQNSWRVVCNLGPFSDPELIDSQIRNLENILSPKQADLSSATSFDIILLFHCYNLGFFTGKLQYRTQAIESAKIGHREYFSELDIYNRAIAYWYLGLLYFSCDDTKKNSIQHLESAERLMEKSIEKFNDDDFSPRLSELRNQIKEWIEFVNFECKGKDTEQKEIKHQGKDASTNAAQSTPPEKTSFKEFSTPSHYLDDPLNKGSTRISLSPNDRIVKSSSPDKNSSTPRPTPAKDNEIPSLGIYEEDRKGGTSVMRKIGNAGPVYEDLLLQFFRKHFKIEFTSSERVDRSAIDQYKWLKVTGESMKDAFPISIHKGDYVLLCESCNPEYHDGKIVIPQLAGKVIAVAKPK